MARQLLVLGISCALLALALPLIYGGVAVGVGSVLLLWPYLLAGVLWFMAFKWLQRRDGRDWVLTAWMIWPVALLFVRFIWMGLTYE